MQHHLLLGWHIASMAAYDLKGGCVSSDPLVRALLSLNGLSVADALGGFFEMCTRLPAHVRLQEPPAPPWHWTDDTLMALSIVDILAQHHSVHQAELSQSFAWRYEHSRGYGSTTRTLLKHFRAGEDWHAAAAAVHDGQGSWGNGSAMRAAPIGAYFADDLEQVVDQAERSAVVTHTHAEAIAGAIAVALAAAWAWRIRDTAAPTAGDFIDLLVPQVPPSEVRNGLLKARELASDTLPEQAAHLLGNGTHVSCPDTVPFAVWNAAANLAHYEQCIWNALRGLGDTDTTAAIGGGIVVLFTGHSAIPHTWYAAREPLPAWTPRIQE